MDNERREYLEEAEKVYEKMVRDLQRRIRRLKRELKDIEGKNEFTRRCALENDIEYTKQKYSEALYDLQSIRRELMYGE